MSMHRLLRRQLKRLGLDPEVPPDAAAWAALLARINTTYTQAESDRASQQHAIGLASEEMRVLNNDLAARVRERTAALFRFTQTIHQSPVSVIISNSQHVIEYVNPHFCRVTGYSEAEAVGARPSLLHSGFHGPAFFQAIESRIHQGEPWQGEICSRKRNGELFWESVTVSPLREPGQEITHFVALREDITQRKRVEAALQEARAAAESASRAKGTFLANMSHEIRTPMNAIMGFAQLLLHDETVTGTARQNVETIFDSGDHLLSIINDILQMSRIEAGRTQLAESTFDLRNLFDGVYAMLSKRAEQKGLGLKMRLDDSANWVIRADQGKLRQVLVNLVSNAIKFTESGWVEVAAQMHEDGKESQLRLTVIDTGVGIDSTDLGRLFVPFEQLEHHNPVEGTGLGLAISLGLARLMGGDLEAQSDRSGSVFTLEIPVARDHLRASETGPLMGRPIAVLGRRRTVLVVDDSAANRELVQQILGPVGFQVETAADGLEALSQFDRHQPDLVLMDRKMPVVDGLTALRMLRCRPSGDQTPVLVVSASAFEKDRLDALAAGANGFVQKPFRSERLLEDIAGLLGLEYRYSVARPEAATSAEGSGAKQLPTLAPDLRGRLEQALIAGDLERFMGLLDGVAEDEGIEGLRKLAHAYEYDQLLALFEVGT